MYYQYDNKTKKLKLIVPKNTDLATLKIYGVEREYLADAPLTLTDNLKTNGHETKYIPRVAKGSSEFKHAFYNNLPLGVASTSTSKLKLFNHDMEWKGKFAKREYYKCQIFSYSVDYDSVEECKRLYDGLVTGKTWGNYIQFTLKDYSDKLSDTIKIPLFSGQLDQDSLNKPRRRIYGKVDKVKLQSISMLSGGPNKLTQKFGDHNGGIEIAGTITCSNPPKPESWKTAYEEKWKLDNPEGDFEADGAINFKEFEISEGNVFELFKKGDNLVYSLGDTLGELTIDHLIDEKKFEVSEEPDLELSKIKVLLFPERASTKVNRKHEVCYHKCYSMDTTITSAITGHRIYLAKTDGLMPGDKVIISKGDIVGTHVVKFVDGKFVILETKVTGISPISNLSGATVVKIPVSEVRYLNKTIHSSQYSLENEDTGLHITFKESAELSITTPKISKKGTVKFTKDSRTVTGIDTNFTKLTVGDWIKSSKDDSGNPREKWFYIVEIEDDTKLTISEKSDTTETRKYNLEYKSPEYFTDEAEIFCNVTGKANKDGNFISTCAEVIQDLMSEVDIDFSIIQDSNALVSFMHPAEPLGEVDTIRDICRTLCYSSFGHIISYDGKLGYNLLDASRKQSETLIFDHTNIRTTPAVSFKGARYRQIEGKYRHFDSGSEVYFYDENFAVQHAALPSETRHLDIHLYHESDVKLILERWGFIYTRDKAQIKFKTNMKLLESKIGDKILIDHPKLWSTYGRKDSVAKIAIITELKITPNYTEIVASDLGDYYAKVGVWSDTTSYSVDTEYQKLLSGYWTNNEGLTNPNEIDTFNSSTWG